MPKEPYFPDGFDPHMNGSTDLCSCEMSDGEHSQEVHGMLDHAEIKVAKAPEGEVASKPSKFPNPHGMQPDYH
jgi:hypothetical protein